MTNLADVRTYEEWKGWAEKEDAHSGAHEWRKDDRSNLYDYRVIRRRLSELRKIRETGDVDALLFYLNEGIHGNTGNMGNPALYSQSHLGTKHLVERYIAEVADALETIAAVDDAVIPHDVKLRFFRREAKCFGRSALMLSGGGALGPFHIGVCKTLLDEDLLPNVVSGASAGAFTAAIVGTHDRAELKTILDSGNMSLEFAEFSSSNLNAWSGRPQIGVEELLHAIDTHIPDMTFAEAYRLTGQSINISVAPLEVNQRSRLLNAITSPNVCIREAVQASCSIPELFPAVTLAAKTREGRRVPYVPSRRWIDGSFSEDLPARRLARLYGINHFIVSQTNPFVLWAVRDTDYNNTVFGRWLDTWEKPMQAWMQATFPLVQRMTADWPGPASLYMRMCYGVAMQDYTADVNIIPRQRYHDPSTLLAILQDHEVRELIREGEIATWPKVEMIANCTRIGRTIDRVLGQLDTSLAA